MTARLRVGFVLGEGQLKVGGVRSVTETLSQSLALSGAEVEWLALERSAEFKEVVATDGVEGAWPLRQVTAPPARTLDELSVAPELEQQVLAWCATRGVEVVHLQHLAGWGLGLPERLARRGLAVTWTLHDYWPVCARGQLWHVDGHACERAEPSLCADCVARTWPQLASADVARDFAGRRLELALRAIDACTRVLVPSAAARDVWLRHGASPERLEVCANPVTRPLTAGRRRTFDPSDVRVGVFGSVQPSKGVLELARRVEALGAPFTLEVHGPRASYHGDSSYVEALEELAARTERVELFDAFPSLELGARLARIDLVAVPSLWEEVFGLVAREARLLGLPVLVSDRGGLAEADAHVVTGGGEGWGEALGRFAQDAAWRGELTAAPPETLASADFVQALFGAHDEAPRSGLA